MASIVLYYKIVYYPSPISIRRWLINPAQDQEKERTIGNSNN